MKIVGFAGFAKSFLAWNLAGAVESSVIYADPRAPYRVWNRHIRIYEHWLDVKRLQPSPALVCVDHEESDVTPEVVVYGVTPDLARVQAAIHTLQQASRPTVLVLVGYEDTGVPWIFPAEFRPTLILPWDMRQATCALVGAPLTRRDPTWRVKFETLWREIQHVASM
ncbi:hypothetical protein [Alicyclobacillus acidocaldarius]|uniref:Uncharacterized protein n=1 Tax=Alicyclobacillus acidocaldarius (strain Tc-4-1) TaxID=1048834 RepID=F8IGL1_ALIAT|nr:hypothetical protein [Alicyclobacillus acidocaldarius]AEJ44291.1 hypothetical protein TC41_2391 [Alicyclobacillus acidocaldarius subsp. acidocaldarius Tc-4-1]